LFSFGLLWLFDSAKTYVELVLTFIHFSKFSMSAMVLPLYLHLQIKKMKIKIKPKHSQIYRPRIPRSLQFRKLKKEKHLIQM
jgi:hypothetical protein